MLDIILLNINPELVCFIIIKAKGLLAKEDVTFTEDTLESEYGYDWSQILADHQDDLTYLEIKKVIEELEPDQQVDLLALMYVGRGDFNGGDWGQARNDAKVNLQPDLADYLLTKPLLPYYLEKGLELLEYSCEK